MAGTNELSAHAMFFDGAVSDARTEAASRPADADAAEKRRLLVLTRIAFTLAVGYLLLFGGPQLTGGLVLFVLLYVASNAVIALLPRAVMSHAVFDTVLVVVDTVVTSAAIYAAGQAGTEVLLLYFAIILMASVGNRLGLSLLACAVTAMAYCGYLLIHGAPGTLLQPAVLLRLPFFLIAGAFYSFFVDRSRRAEIAARTAEAREETRTEFLKQLTEDIRQPLATAQHLASLLEATLDPAERQQKDVAAQVATNLRCVADLIGFMPCPGKAPAGRPERPPT